METFPPFHFFCKCGAENAQKGLCKGAGAHPSAQTGSTGLKPGMLWNGSGGEGIKGEMNKNYGAEREAEQGQEK